MYRYADESAAREAIRDREVYGAVVAGQRGPVLLTASAASPVVAQLLQQAVAGQAPEGTDARVTDVVAAPAADPRGAGAGGAVLTLSVWAVLGLLVAALGRPLLRAGAAAGGEQRAERHPAPVG